MLSSINERSIDPRSYVGAPVFPSRGVSFAEGTFVPRHRASSRIKRGRRGGGSARREGGGGAKIELRCQRYPPESRSIWKRGETRSRPRNPPSPGPPAVASCVSRRLRKLSPVPSFFVEPRFLLVPPHPRLPLLSLRASPFLLRSIREIRLFFRISPRSLHRIDVTYRLLTGGQRLIP